MNRFAIVLPYFGKFKPSVSLFLESCNRNDDVDFLFFTDCEIPDGIVIKKHVFWYRTTLKEIRELAEEKLQEKVALERAYKLCDLRAFYGLIFQDYLRGYEYWGYGDMDVVYGRITRNLDMIPYSDYDKISWTGHLSLIRNTEKCNSIAFSEVADTKDAKEVLTTEKNLAFDERDYNRKFLGNNLKVYTGHWAADIDLFYWRMRCSDKKTFRLLLDTPEITYAPKNYLMQVFAVIEGVTYRVYLKNKKVMLEEFAYIHFRKEVPIHVPNGTDTYILTRESFESVEGGRAAFEDYDKVKALIEKWNCQEGFWREWHCFFVQWYRKLSGKRGW